jgi:hypothetical protein
MVRQIFLWLQNMRCAYTRRQSLHTARRARMRRGNENEILKPDAEEEKG